jgi:hypothetical protein
MFVSGHDHEQTGRGEHVARPRRRTREQVLQIAGEWDVHDRARYAYLLGCYLGDGNIVHKPPRTWTLRISCDRTYAAIEREIRTAMEVTFPGAASRQRPNADESADVVSITHPAIGRAFPQHGRGRKHLRPIALTDWQLALTTAEPAALIRGLIHSDGCRVINRFTTRLPSGRLAEYSYVRYFFSNLSQDIRRIFADHCALLGVRVTQSNARNLSIADRRSVAVLDAFIGPKS